MPDGTWTRESLFGKITFDVQGDRVRIDFEGSSKLTGVKGSMRCEHATASDGTVFGIIHAVDLELDPVTAEEIDAEELMIMSMLHDLPFAMRVHADQDAMIVKSITVGMPASFLNEDMSGLGVYSMYLSGNYESAGQ